MLTEDEKRFLQYWEINREKHSGFTYKLLYGLPSALLFFLPILILLIAIYFFLPDWYSKVASSLKGSITVIIIAILLASVFFAYIKMHFRWENYEQKYRELKIRLGQKAAKNDI